MAKIECNTVTEGFKQGEIYQSEGGKVVMCTRDTQPGSPTFEGVLLYNHERPTTLNIGGTSATWPTSFFSPWHGVMHIEA